MIRKSLLYALAICDPWAVITSNPRESLRDSGPEKKGEKDIAIPVFAGVPSGGCGDH